MLSEGVWLSKDEEKGLETGSGSADFGEPILTGKQQLNATCHQAWKGQHTLTCIAVLKNSEVFSEETELQQKQLGSAACYWQDGLWRRGGPVVWERQPQAAVLQQCL